jgi:acetylornithine deacetylase/succinyl-diaminopimelate desuccinylase-like protein
MIDLKPLRLLTELVAMQSVSADPKRLGEMSKIAKHISHIFKNIGFEVELVSKQCDKPLVVAYFKNKKAKETVGIYAHYDIQPEDPADAWGSDPFVLTERNGKYYGRGVADNKGHIVQVMTALSELIKQGELGYSVVVIIEGEEECGATSFESLLGDVSICNLYEIDAWFIFDSGMKSKGVPQILTGLRGIVSGEMSLSTAYADAHSGLFGNRIPNSAQIMTHIFAKIKDEATGKILIDGFYDDIQAITDDEYISLVSNAESKEGLIKRSKSRKILENQFVPKIYPSDMPPALYSKLIPSFDINGIWSGYTGVGPKTIIPGWGSVKFSVRLVQGQSGQKMKNLINAFFAGIIPSWIKYEVKLESSEAVGVSTDDRWVKLAADKLGEYFGRKAVFNRSGGSIPAVETIFRLYGNPIVITGFTLPDENIHAPDENIDKDMFFEGIEALKSLLAR